MINSSMPPDGFEDEVSGPPDGFADQPPVQPGPDYEGAFGSMAPAAKMVADVGSIPGRIASSIPLMGEFAKTASGGAMGLGQTAMEGAGRLFNKSGEAVTENLSREGIRPLFAREGLPVSPRVAAGLGTLTQMTPDIVSAMATPVQTEGVVGPAVPMARRALGFQKSFLKTPFARGQATKAATTALEEGVIPYSGSPETMMERAKGIATKSGGRISKKIKDVPLEAQETWTNLENLRGQITKGIGREGNMAGVHKAIDEVQNDVADLIAQQSTKPSNKLFAKDLNYYKNRLGKKLNFLADATSQLDNKTVVNNLANTVRSAVKKFISPEEFAQYLADQKFYNAAELMQKGLNNELAAQMGNKVISPYSVIAGGAQLAAGQPTQAAATIGLTEGLMRRGMGAGARATQDVFTALPNIVKATAPAIARTMLNKEKAQEYLDKAGGDKNLARKMAKDDGYDIPKARK
jgi:hypothetical protein